MPQTYDLPQVQRGRSSNVLEVPSNTLEGVEGPYQGGWHGFGSDPITYLSALPAAGMEWAMPAMTEMFKQAALYGAAQHGHRYGSGSRTGSYGGGYPTSPGPGTEFPSGHVAGADPTRGLETEQGGPIQWGGPTRPTASFSTEGPTYNYDTQRWGGGPSRPTELGPNAGKLFTQDPTRMLRPSDIGPAINSDAGRSLFSRMIRDLANRLDAKYGRAADVPKGGKVYETSGRRGPSAPGRGGAGWRDQLPVDIGEHGTLDEQLRQHGTPEGLTRGGEPIPMFPMEQRPPVITTPSGRVLFSTGGGWSPRTEYDYPRMTTPIRDIYSGMASYSPFEQRGVPTTPLPSIEDLFGEGIE